MDGVNRVLGVVVAIVLAAVGAALVYASVVNLSGTVKYVQAWAAYLGDGLDLTSLQMLGAVGGVVVLVGILLFYLEAPKPPRTTVKLRKIRGATGVIMVEAIRQRVQHDVEAIPDVQPTNVQVVSKGRSVVIKLDVVSDPYTEPASKAEEVSRIIRDAVEGQMGVRIRGLNVKVAHGAIHTAGGHHEGIAGHQEATTQKDYRENGPFGPEDG